MSNLRVVILLVGDDLEPLSLTFAALYSRYGIEQFDIVGVLGNAKISIHGRELRNIPSVDELKNYPFDYVIASGGGLNSSDLAAQKKIFADKLNVNSDAIIFDFEIYNGLFRFPKVCLVVIFNHRFDRNLPLLRKIYGARFSNIRFLMPFYDGSDADVIPVYESSHQFQGYLIQAYDKLKDIPCSHYLFIGDDLILNPDFDEVNFVSRTNMRGRKFLSLEILPLNIPNRFSKWYWAAGSSKSFYDAATSWRGSLCTYDEALSKFNDFFGVKYKETYDQDFFGDPNKPGANVLGSWNNAKSFFNVVNYFIATNKNSLKIPYPMGKLYSDIFCVDKDSLFEFSRLCGIFSAMNLFVEIAIPTAAVLTYKRSDVEFLPESTVWRLWDNDRNNFERKYNGDFGRLYREWDEKIFCIHPVKLSGWKVL